MHTHTQARTHTHTQARTHKQNMRGKFSRFAYNAENCWKLATGLTLTNKLTLAMLLLSDSAKSCLSVCMCVCVCVRVLSWRGWKSITRTAVRGLTLRMCCGPATTNRCSTAVSNANSLHSYPTTHHPSQTARNATMWPHFRSIFQTSVARILKAKTAFLIK